METLISYVVALAIVILPGLLTASLLASLLPGIEEPAYYALMTYVGAAFISNWITKGYSGKAN